jgi:hypothetical protein
MELTFNLTHITPTYHEHEGYTYLEYNGTFFKGCKRCGGSGHFSFDGYDSLCYTCRNTSAKLGEAFATEAAAQKWCHERAVRRAQAERKRERAYQALVTSMQANQRAVAAADQEVHDFLASIDLEDYEGEKDAFIRSMAEVFQWPAQSREFTANMIGAVRRTMERRTNQAAEAASHPAPTGRVAVTGEILSTRVVEGAYGTAYKVLVKDDEGFKVWCSLPAKQAEEARDAFWSANYEDRFSIGGIVWFSGSSNEPEHYAGVKGRRITFTATLEPSKDDVAFAFGSRPTKGAWL